jgi:hypothetical protein
MFLDSTYGLVDEAPEWHLESNALYHIERGTVLSFGPLVSHEVDATAGMPKYRVFSEEEETR